MLPTKLTLHHDTSPKYTHVFTDLVKTGFNLHCDSDYKRTDLLKVCDYTVPKSDADKIHKSLTQKCLAAKKQLQVQLRPYKHLVAGDGWYFCLLLISGNLQDANAITETKTEAMVRSITSDNTASLLDSGGSNYGNASLESTTAINASDAATTALATPTTSQLPTVILTAHDREMIALYGDLYVPHKER